MRQNNISNKIKRTIRVRKHRRQMMAPMKCEKQDVAKADDIDCKLNKRSRIHKKILLHRSSRARRLNRN